MKEFAKQKGKKAIIILAMICVISLAVGLVAGCNKEKGGDKILTLNPCSRRLRRANIGLCLLPN